MRLLYILLLTFNFLLLTSNVYAAGEFKSSYNVIYNISEDGNTVVDQEISLTNQLTTLYPIESEITLGSANIYNLTATDNVGKIYIKVSKQEDSTKVRAYFNEKIVGIGKTYKWYLRYETPELVSLNGLIKEVNIPKLELDPDIDEYNLTVNVPDSFKPVLYVKPENNNSLVFNKNDLSRGQVSIAFGKTQIFNFNLSYYLKNNNITPTLTEIALPMDTPYQKIYLKDLTPKPLNVEVDADGNWMAKYQLNPEQAINVLASGSAQLFLKPQYSQSFMSFNPLKTFIQSDKYWESGNPRIKQIANDLQTPENIYKYVVNSLKYDYNRVANNPQRMGALYMLDHTENAICMEFTDLFIALTRALGIPSREIDGFAYTNNNKLRPLSYKKDILHSWPEYYDDTKKQWIQIDPTWGSTTGGIDFFHTFDLNHMAFAIKGQSSVYPFPAGSYKNPKVDSKDVEVAFGSMSDIDDYENIKLSLISQKQVYSGFVSTLKAVIENNGYISTKKQPLTIKIDNATITSAPSVDIEPIPPYGRREIHVNFKPNNNLSEKSLNVQAFYADKAERVNITVKPLTLVYFIPVLIAALVIFIIALFLKIYGNNKNKR